MFKVGDIIKINENSMMGQLLKKYDYQNFVVSYLDTDRYGERLYEGIGLKDRKIIMFSDYEIRMADKECSRRKKLEKICSKLGM